MTKLIAGLLIFFIPHSVSIVNSIWRDRMVERISEIPWKGIYSLISIIGLVLIIVGYGEARQNPMILYISPGWLKHIAMLLMVPVFPLLFAAYLPGRIKTATKHPMLLATKIWALAHLLTNGTLADVLLFGAFLVWAIADRISVKHRPPRAVPAIPVAKINDVIAIVAGLGIYAAFVIWLHVRITGMPLLS